MSFLDLLQAITQASGPRAALWLLLAFLGFHLAPLAAFIAAVSTLVVCEWITAAVAAIWGATPADSRGFLFRLLKIILSSMASILVTIVEQTYWQGHVLVYALSAYIAVAELFANLRNIGAITGTDLVSVIQRIINEKISK
jgi:hypothetical protein